MGVEVEVSVVLALITFADSIVLLMVVYVVGASIWKQLHAEEASGLGRSVRPFTGALFATGAVSGVQFSAVSVTVLEYASA